MLKYKYIKNYNLYVQTNVPIYPLPLPSPKKQQTNKQTNKQTTRKVGAYKAGFYGKHICNNGNN